MIGNLDFSGLKFLPESIKIQYDIRDYIKKIIISQCLFYSNNIKNSIIYEKDIFKFGFIGCGDMGESILENLIKNGYNFNEIIISTRHPEKFDKYIYSGCECSYDNSKVINKAKFVFICCNPCNLNEISFDCKNVIENSHCMCSIADEISQKKINSLFKVEHSLHTIIVLIINLE